MSKRIVFIVMGLISLIAGGAIYLIFRENATVSIIAQQYADFGKIRGQYKSFNNPFIMFYAGDFLWSFSLLNLLFAVFVPNKLKALILSVSVVIYGVIWEILQLVNNKLGTFDLFDILMYFLAAIAVYLINLRMVRVNEKNY